MAEYTRKPMGREYPEPPPEEPAEQPPTPGGGEECEELPTYPPPTLEAPAPCPDPPSNCKCPPGAGQGSSPTKCLEDLIAKQVADMALAEKAKACKADLEKLLEGAKKGNLAYTRDKYVELVKAWVDQDAAIAELLRKLTCAVDCWRCILECHVCPLLNEIRDAEQWLYNDGKIPTEVYTLYDLQYWHQRNVAALRRRFNRIDAVLKVWASPAETIGKALAANKALYDNALKVLGSEPGKAIYGVFLQLVPMHLAIAPPADVATTKIRKEYTEFCECIEGSSDDCCGPDVGAWSLRRRLIGPQPYLVDPNDYFKVICCLIEKRYGPAKEALNDAETELATVTGQITKNEDRLKDGWIAAFEAAARAAIPSVIDCCDYEPDEEPEQKPQRGY